MVPTDANTPVGQIEYPLPEQQVIPNGDWRLNEKDYPLRHPGYPLIWV